MTARPAISDCALFDVGAPTLLALAQSPGRLGVRGGSLPEREVDARGALVDAGDQAGGRPRSLFPAPVRERRELATLVE